MFQANQLPKEKPPVEEPKEEVKTYTLNLSQIVTLIASNLQPTIQITLLTANLLIQKEDQS